MLDEDDGRKQVVMSHICITQLPFVCRTENCTDRLFLSLPLGFQPDGQEDSEKDEGPGPTLFDAPRKTRWCTAHSDQYFETSALSILVSLSTHSEGR